MGKIKVGWGYMLCFGGGDDVEILFGNLGKILLR